MWYSNVRKQALPKLHIIFLVRYIMTFVLCLLHMSIFHRLDWFKLAFYKWTHLNIFKKWINSGTGRRPFVQNSTRRLLYEWQKFRTCWGRWHWRSLAPSAWVSWLKKTTTPVYTHSCHQACLPTSCLEPRGSHSWEDPVPTGSALQPSGFARCSARSSPLQWWTRDANPCCHFSPWQLQVSSLPLTFNYFDISHQLPLPHIWLVLH